MKNSHYVPRFILKKFSDKLCLYNVKTGEFKENVKPDIAFAEKGFYSDEIEEISTEIHRLENANNISEKCLCKRVDFSPSEDCSNSRVRTIFLCQKRTSS